MPTVFPEQLIDVVIAADAARRRQLGMSPARFQPGQRIYVEPWFNFLGMCWGRTMRLLPSVLRRPLDLWLCEKLAGHPPEENPQLNGRIAETVALARRLRDTHGRWPALLLLTSHPQTTGELAWLRFEVLRQGMQIADAVVAARSASPFAAHPQCFLAIDPYALDTVSPPVGGFYAAWMHQTYLAWDRQSATQSWLQKRVLLRGSDYSVIAWRLLETLRRDIPVLMALPGGLPHNARLLYAAREFVQQLPLKKWDISKIAAAKQFMTLLAEPVAGVRAPEEGELVGPTRASARAYLERLGLHGAQLDNEFNTFAREFRRAVPYRERFFRVLRQRLSDKGKPVLLVAVSHDVTSPHVRISAPCELAALSGHFADGRFD